MQKRGIPLSEGDFSATARSVAVARLKDDILSGRIPGGTRLLQAEVSARFGISTTPVREAFRELATIGLVEILPHRGALVLQPTTTDLQNIYEVRQLLEPICVAWAAELITKSELNKAKQLLKAMSHGRSRDDITALNREFHSIIANACGNPHMASVVINLLDLSTPYVARVTASTPGRQATQRHEHQEILQACSDRDPEAAYQAARTHLTQLHTEPGDQSSVERIRSALSQRWLPFKLDLPEIAGPASAPSDARR